MAAKVNRVEVVGVLEGKHFIVQAPGYEVPHPLDPSITVLIHRAIKGDSILKNKWVASDKKVGGRFTGIYSSPAEAEAKMKEIALRLGVDKYKTAQEKYPRVEVVKLQNLYGGDNVKSK